MSPRLGRRPGPGSAREDLVNAARDLFAEHGVDGASVRAIAARAGVDPALVYRFFGSKDGLVEATMLHIGRPDRAIAVLDGPPGTQGEALVRAMLELWRHPLLRKIALGLVRSSLSNDTARHHLTEVVERQVIARVRNHVHGPDADTRIALIGTQMAGLVITRYLLEVEPTASLDDDVIVRNVGATIQRYFDGPLV